MTVPVSRPVPRYGAFGRLWWLPAGGLGNGLDDVSWAPVLEISERVVPNVLTGLRRAGVPAYAAPFGTVADALRDRSERPPGYQLWVGGSAYGEAESALLILMPLLSHGKARRDEGAERDGGSDQAWR